jgi:hypothetical protein
LHATFTFSLARSLINAHDSRYKPLAHPTDPSHPPLIGLFFGESGVAAGDELRWDYYNDRPQRGTPKMHSIGKVAPSSGPLSNELARDAATGQQHIACWHTECVWEVHKRLGNERSFLEVDGVDDRDRRRACGDEEDYGAASCWDHEAFTVRAVYSTITDGGRWEIPHVPWQADRPFSIPLHLLSSCMYWEPVPLVGFPGVAQ